MDKRRGSWLEGPSSARPYDPDHFRGKQLGLPQSGPGSLAGSGARVGAYLLDALIAGAIGGIVDVHQRGVVGLVAFVVMTAVLLATAGQTIGMRVLHLRVVPLGRLRFPWLVAVIVRTVLLAALVPAVIFDRDSRGLHDRISGTGVVRV